MKTQQRSLLKPDIEKLLNNQIKKESESSNHYLGKAIWCDVNGYKGSTSWLYAHAEEERTHMLKIIHYLIEQQAQPIISAIDSIQPNHNSLRELFENVLQQEREVTASIHHLIGHCRKVNDYRTENFLQWFIDEQREEEDQAQKILDLFKIIGEKNIGLYTIDKEIGKLTKQKTTIA